MAITMLAALMLAYFLLLYGAVAFIQDKRFYGSAPKERNKSSQRCEHNSFMALVAFVSNTINNKDSDKEGRILSQPSADSFLCGRSQGRFRACGHKAVAF